MKIGDYVRTDTGIIEKLEGIHEQNKTNNTITKLNKMGGGRYAHILDINSEFAEEFDKDFSRGNIIKSSPNIIDLIEVGDFITYRQGNIYWNIPERVSGRYNRQNEQTDLIVNGTPLEHLEILSIVTKEQFEGMKYNV